MNQDRYIVNIRRAADLKIRRIHWPTMLKVWGLDGLGYVLFLVGVRSQEDHPFLGFIAIVIGWTMIFNAGYNHRQSEIEGRNYGPFNWLSDKGKEHGHRFSAWVRGLRK